MKIKIEILLLVLVLSGCGRVEEDFIDTLAYESLPNTTYIESTEKPQVETRDAIMDDYEKEINFDKADITEIIEFVFSTSMDALLSQGGTCRTIIGDLSLESSIDKKGIIKATGNIYKEDEVYIDSIDNIEYTVNNNKIEYKESNLSLVIHSKFSPLYKISYEESYRITNYISREFKRVSKFIEDTIKGTYVIAIGIENDTYMYIIDSSDYTIKNIRIFYNTANKQILDIDENEADEIYEFTYIYNGLIDITEIKRCATKSDTNAYWME